MAALAAEQMQRLKHWLEHVAEAIRLDGEPQLQEYSALFHEPELVLPLVDVMDALDEAELNNDQAYYSACVFAFDIGVAQLQVGYEAENKQVIKTMRQLMGHLAHTIAGKKHTLGFWLPVLNSFYEVHVDLSDELKQAYFDLAEQEEGDFTLEEDGEQAHLEAIRSLIHELSDLSVFDIAENFFAQSYAMPADFFVDLVFDLYSLEEGQDIALLTLLHPKQEVRDIVLPLFDQVMTNVTLSSVSLSRLQAIKAWYPAQYHELFNRWIKDQRKKGVVFQVETTEQSTARFKASEVDGSGAQGLFIHLQQKSKAHRLVGLLFKRGFGLKDVWVTPEISAQDAGRYVHESRQDNVTLREVDLAYVLMMVNHFLAETLAQGMTPDLHLLEVQEALGVHFYPQRMDLDSVMEQLAVQITPFTPERMEQAMKRTKAWPGKRRFTESWYVESAAVDRLVNQCCSFVDGVKVCRFPEAMELVFSQELERHRSWWQFHFLWIALWLKSGARKNEVAWQDSLLIAHAIQSGHPLNSLPIMQEICRESVVNSIETMQERRTHLN